MAPAKKQKKSGRALLAWVALAAIAGALCTVVAIAGPRAPSATPFFAAGAAVAVGAVAGALLQLSKESLRLHPAAHAAIAVGVAFIAVLPAGLLKYTYGSEGSVVLTMNAAPLYFNFGEVSLISGELSLYNDGATTVRLRPIMEVRLADRTGQPRPQIIEGCTVVVPPPPTEADLIEIGPGVVFTRPFTLRLASFDANNTAPTCGAYLITQPGVYQLHATLESHPFNAFALVPVWSASLSSAPLRLEVH